ncbi:MAG: hypothetical protein OEW35_16055 [Gammaproteobacteria bacterium]|nr:hypothetical protein [Gammaproteobacteria bacterium]MDH4256178.1 hypothetical protein [Gammaproteobacteria bacterium]MDH5312185.1 hypothetical protein [Gammaproteobacteria bacterium]
MNENETIEPTGPDRWTLIRDIAALQIKLLADGLRDLVLVPVSLAVGLISLLKGGERPGTEFYELLRAGKKSERWINLFGAAERVFPGHDTGNLDGKDIDGMLAGVESYIVDEYRRGGITAQAKERLDKVLDSVQRVADRQRRKPD